MIRLYSLLWLLALTLCGSLTQAFVSRRPSSVGLRSRLASSMPEAVDSTADTTATTDPSPNTDIASEERLGILETHPVILFDGVCNFCNAWVDILIRLDARGRYKLAPLQSSFGKALLQAVGREPDDISSIVLVKQGSLGNKEDLQCFIKSQCVLKVVEELGPPAALASRAAETLVPLSLRDTIYDTVAENRYTLMGKRNECRCGDPEYADRFLS